MCGSDSDTKIRGFGRGLVISAVIFGHLSTSAGICSFKEVKYDRNIDFKVYKLYTRSLRNTLSQRKSASHLPLAFAGFSGAAA